MTTQWMRRASLAVDYRVSDLGDMGQPDTTLDLSELRFRFQIRHGTLGAPGHADIRIYNVAPQTAAALESAVTNAAADPGIPGRHRRSVTIQAGYRGGQFGAIFKGELIQTRRGKESPVDSYVDLTVVDGDSAYTQGVVSVSLAAGSTVRDRLRAIAQALTGYGVTYDESEWPDLPERRLPRGCVLHGMAWRKLDELAKENGFSWWVYAGRLHIMRKSDALPGEAVVLSSHTGLIGLPEQTQGGIMARCLINPEIRPGCLVKIDQASIQQQRLNIGVGAINAPGWNIPDISADGIYRVLAIDYMGDTRGNEWYQHLTLLVPGQQLPSTLGILPVATAA